MRTKVIESSAKRTEAAAAFEHAEGDEASQERLPLWGSPVGPRRYSELCDNLHSTAYNSPSRRSPSSRPRPGLGRPCCQRVAAPELRRARAGAASGRLLVGGPGPGGSTARGPVSQIKSRCHAPRGTPPGGPRPTHHDARQEGRSQIYSRLRSYGDSRPCYYRTSIALGRAEIVYIWLSRLASGPL